MKQRELIALLERQRQVSDERIKDLLAQLSDARARIDSLLEEVASLKEALLSKGKSLETQKAVSKGLSKILKNESEKQKPEEQQKTEEEMEAEKERKKARRKAKGNFGARRNPHYECEERTVHIYPDTEGAEADRIREIGTETVVRYGCEPLKIFKTIYILHKQCVDGELREPQTPPSAFYKSNYESSFVATLLELHHCHQMPVERIVKYINAHGFELAKPTAHHLIKKSADIFDSLHKAMRTAVKEDSYMGCDETYSLVKLDMPNPKGKGKCVRKGYMWVAVGHNTGLVYFFYDDGSRKESVFVEFIKGYLGIIQTDGLKIYRKTGDDPDNGITRIACIQHIKREFLDLKGIPEADNLFRLYNSLYHNDHQHKIGKDGWSVEDHRRWRQEYAPPILDKIETELKRIIADPGLPPDCDLRSAVVYAYNEMKYVRAIFDYGFTRLDNNLVEIINRYISMRRRSSLFFGSHAGAKRYAILLSLACSCRQLGINFRQYIIDTLNAASKLPPTAPLDKWRLLLPDKYKINNTEVNNTEEN